MNKVFSIALCVLLFLVLFVLCAIWHHITSIRYRKVKDEKGKQYKWYQLFGKLNEIGFWVKFIAVVLFALTLFISLHYLCTTYPHHLSKTPDFDYISVICAFFGVLVTLLVGWNIYNSIENKRKMESLEDDQDFLGEFLLKAQQSSENSKAYMFRFMSQSWAIQLLADKPNKQMAMMIGHAIASIDIFIRNNDTNTAEKTLNELMYYINKAKDIQLTDIDKAELRNLIEKMSDISKLSKIDELKKYLT